MMKNSNSSNCSLTFPSLLFSLSATLFQIYQKKNVQLTMYFTIRCKAIQMIANRSNFYGKRKTSQCDTKPNEKVSHTQHNTITLIAPKRKRKKEIVLEKATSHSQDLITINRKKIYFSQQEILTPKNNKRLSICMYVVAQQNLYGSVFVSIDDCGAMNFLETLEFAIDFVRVAIPISDFRRMFFFWLSVVQTT